MTEDRKYFYKTEIGIPKVAYLKLMIPSLIIRHLVVFAALGIRMSSKWTTVKYKTRIFKLSHYTMVTQC
jgi:hypothetical protein